MTAVRAILVAVILAVAPAAAAQSYRVRDGDTIASIARRLGCSQRALRKVNAIDRRARIAIGQRLQIPDPTDERRRALSKNPRIGTIDMAYWLLSNPPVGRLRAAAGPGPHIPMGLHFPSPRNVIGRGYGQGRHGGHRALDIGARMRDKITAAESGVVAFAGRFRGYGIAVILAHPGLAVTIYGHLSRAVVHPGRHVRRGQVIGRAGSTGNSTGPHLHFELRVDGRPIDAAHSFEGHPVIAGPYHRGGADPDQDREEPDGHGAEIDEDEEGVSDSAR